MKKYLFLLFAFVAIFIFGAATRTEVTPPITATIQPAGSDTIHWTSGKYLTKTRAGVACIAKGFDVWDTCSGGILKVHLYNDYDSRNKIVWTEYKIPESNGVIQRIGLYFDQVDSAGTTVNIRDILVFH